MDYKAIAERLGPRSKVAQEWVYQVLKSGIVSGELKPGTQLKQDEISAALNVSHIPVREAVRRLEATGLVVIHQNRGASVSVLSRETIVDMMEVRATLSMMLLKSSAPMLTKEDYEELYRIVDEQETTQDLFRTEQLNYLFHERLCGHADNDFARLMLNMVHDNIDRYVRSDFYSSPENRKLSAKEHRMIVDACLEGRYDDACELLRAHILNAKQYIPEDLHA